MPSFKIHVATKEERLKHKLKHLKEQEKTKKEKVQQKNTAEKQIPDVVSEQIEEQPYQTDFCPEAVLDVKKIKQHPEEFIEINVVKRSRVVDVFCIPVERKTFHYKKKRYDVKEDGIYLMPTKSGLLMPASYYREGKSNPALFKNTNKGITGKALSLLYKDELYRQILYAEDVKYNLFIVILLIATLIAFAVGAYFVFFHNGGMFTPPPVTPPWEPGTTT